VTRSCSCSACFIRTHPTGGERSKELRTKMCTLWWQ